MKKYIHSGRQVEPTAPTNPLKKVAQQASQSELKTNPKLSAKLLRSLKSFNEDPHVVNQIRDFTQNGNIIKLRFNDGRAYSLNVNRLDSIWYDRVWDIMTTNLPSAGISQSTFDVKAQKSLDKSV